VDPYQTTQTGRFVHWRPAAVAAFLTLIVAINATARTGILGGLRSDNWNRFATVNLIHTVSDDLALLGGTDVGGGQVVGHANAIIRWHLTETIELGFILGPEMTIHQPDISDDDKITYIAASVGASISWKATEKLTFWAAAEYAKSKAELSAPSLGTGLILWGNSKD